MSDSHWLRPVGSVLIPSQRLRAHRWMDSIMPGTRGQTLFPDLRFTSQSSTAITHCLIVATHLTNQLRKEAWVKLAFSGIRTQTSCTRGGDSNHSATQTDSYIPCYFIRNEGSVRVGIKLKLADLQMSNWLSQLYEFLPSPKHEKYFFKYKISYKHITILVQSGDRKPCPIQIYCGDTSRCKIVLAV